jgi:hypothetical protein
MNNPKSVPCPGCAGEMKLQIDHLDLGWAGDGPYARDLDFAGILADVYCCHACGRISIRPVILELPRSQRTVAA